MVYTTELMCRVVLGVMTTDMLLSSNQEGVSSEIMAIAQGHNEIAELLSKMKPDKRDQCVRQLLPGTEPLNRVKVKVFGSSGVGKSTLIDSLKCTYFGSFFRKSRLMATKDRPVKGL